MAENTTPQGIEADESPTLGKLAAALAKAQGAMHNAEKTANNPGFNRKYATLAAVWDACREPLAANGLAVVQRVGGGDGRVILTTDLLHAESGEFMRSRLAVPADPEGRRNAVQALGSAVTYARRYALAALVGVAVEDDDGESAGAKGGKRPEREDPRPPAQERKSSPVPEGKRETASAPTEAPPKKPLVVEVRPGETEEAARMRAVYETAVELIGKAQSLAQVDKIIRSATGKTDPERQTALEAIGWDRKKALRAHPEPGAGG